VDEEMAEGGQVGDSKGGGPRKSGWAGEGEGEGVLHRLLFLRAQPLALSPPPPFHPPSRSLSPGIATRRLSFSLARARAFLGPSRHAHRSTLSLSRSRSHPVPSLSLSLTLSPAFPHPCGTSRKLYVPTLATLNAGLARDNPRPSPPPSATAPPSPSAVLPISATRRQPLFSPLADGPPGFTTS